MKINAMFYIYPFYTRHFVIIAVGAAVLYGTQWERNKGAARVITNMMFHSSSTSFDAAEIGHMQGNNRPRCGLLWSSYNDKYVLN